jgi:hypothetical protein
MGVAFYIHTHGQACNMTGGHLDMDRQCGRLSTITLGANATGVDLPEQFCLQFRHMLQPTSLVHLAKQGLLGQEGGILK